MVFCSFPSCKNSSDASDSGISFFGFPKDQTLRTKWVEQILSNCPEFDSSGKCCLCSAHFEKDYLERREDRTLLKKGGIPTLFFTKKTKTTSPVKKSSIKKSPVRKSTVRERKVDLKSTTTFELKGRAPGTPIPRLNIKKVKKIIQVEAKSDNGEVEVDEPPAKRLKIEPKPKINKAPITNQEITNKIKRISQPLPITRLTQGLKQPQFNKGTVFVVPAPKANVRTPKVPIPKYKIIKTKLPPPVANSTGAITPKIISIQSFNPNKSNNSNQKSTPIEPVKFKVLTKKHQVVIKSPVKSPADLKKGDALKTESDYALALESARAGGLLSGSTCSKIREVMLQAKNFDKALNMSLQLFSISTYEYLRRNYNTKLEVPSIARRILVENTVTGARRGFINKNFVKLNTTSLAKKYKVLINLVVSKCRLPQGNREIIDYGHGFKENRAASFVLIMMGVCVNGNWKVPLGYFSVAEFNGRIVGNLVKLCISLLRDNNVCPVSAICSEELETEDFVREVGMNLNHMQLQSYITYEAPLPKLPKSCVFFIPDLKGCLSQFQKTFERCKMFFCKEHQINVAYFYEIKSLGNVHDVKLSRLLKIAEGQTDFFLTLENVEVIEHCLHTLKLPAFSGAKWTCEFVKALWKVMELMNYCKTSKDNKNTKAQCADLKSYLESVRVIGTDLPVIDICKRGLLGFVRALQFYTNFRETWHEVRLKPKMFTLNHVTSLCKLIDFSSQQNVLENYQDNHKAALLSLQQTFRLSDDEIVDSEDICEFRDVFWKDDKKEEAGLVIRESCLIDKALNDEWITKTCSRVILSTLLETIKCFKCRKVMLGLRGPSELVVNVCKMSESLLTSKQQLTVMVSNVTSKIYEKNLLGIKRHRCHSIKLIKHISLLYFRIRLPEKKRKEEVFANLMLTKKQSQAKSVECIF